MRILLALLSVLIVPLSVTALPQANSMTRSFSFQPQSASALPTTSLSAVTSALPPLPTSLSSGNAASTTVLVTETNGASSSAGNVQSVLNPKHGSNPQTVIIITCVVGIVMMIIVTLVLIFCYRRFKSFIPLRDDEVECWKSVSKQSHDSGDRKEAIPAALDKNVYAHPTLTNSYTAPNAKAGLTDAAVPGQPAFLPIPPRRSSTRHKISHTRTSLSLSSQTDTLVESQPAELRVPPVIPEVPRNDKDSLNFDKRSIMSLMKKW